MKVVILAGGKGTRISEESRLKPKPMVEIGEMPLLLHLIKNFIGQGFDDFIVCAGYKQQYIKQYFANYQLFSNDVEFSFGDKMSTRLLKKNHASWRVSIIDTGLETNTGGRIRRVKNIIGDGEFVVTYGDGLSDIDMHRVIELHRKSDKVGTISVYNYGQSKGVVELDSCGNVVDFREKSNSDGELINIGFMVFKNNVFDYIKSDQESFENGALTRLKNDDQLSAYVHRGFWQCMDTMSEKNKLEALWESEKAPWKNWDD